MSIPENGQVRLGRQCQSSVSDSAGACSDSAGGAGGAGGHLPVHTSLYRILETNYQTNTKNSKNRLRIN